jgi:hypothetical protein
LLRFNPDWTRENFLAALSQPNTPLENASTTEQSRALNLAVKAMTMISCGTENQPENLLEAGLIAKPWRNDTTFSQFILDTFPVTDFPCLNDPNSSRSNHAQATLTGRRLKKLAGLRFQPTEDVRRHLRLNHRTGVVEIFHYTSFLKEHLRLTKDLPRSISVSDSIKAGALPRQLVLEILDSIQKILFPLSDPKACTMLRSFTTSSNSPFDPDCLRFESSAIRHPDEKEISYIYFGTQLMTLYHELENPTPRSYVDKWLERRSGARYVMMATLAGAVIAVFLGLASLTVSSYQTWIAYQQWKHPVNK